MKLQASRFGIVNFGNAKLGDARRTQRLVQTANLMQRRPGRSLPPKIRNPKDLRAFYRLMNTKDVTQGRDKNLEEERYKEGKETKGPRGEHGRLVRLGADQSAASETGKPRQRAASDVGGSRLGG